MAASITPGYAFASTEQVTAAKLASLVSGSTITGITNTEIASDAAIAYSKINVTAAAINYDRLNLTGGIVNADVSASAAIVASKLDLTSPGAIGSTAAGTGAFSTLKVGTTNQGDILYDNGTSLVRLTPGTSGKYLKTQGAGANPTWDSVATNSNVLFQYSAITSNSVTLATGVGEIIGSNESPTTGGTLRFLQGVTTVGNYTTLYKTKFTKIAGISTVTVYAEVWGRGAGNSSNRHSFKTNIGGQVGTYTSGAEITSPAWNSLTVDVSSLNNGTVYDVTISAGVTTGNSNYNIYLGNIIAFGS